MEIHIPTHRSESQYPKIKLVFNIYGDYPDYINMQILNEESGELLYIVGIQKSDIVRLANTIKNIKQDYSLKF